MWFSNRNVLYKSVCEGSPDDDSKTVTMLVSSKQMILTSPVFEAMLGDDRFKEGADLLADDKVDIELPEDDPVAFAIKTARAQVFSEGFAALNGFLERVTEPRSHCDDQDDVCGIVTAGSFLKSMVVNGCWPLRPERYRNTNLRRLFKGISKIEIRTNCLVRQKVGYFDFPTMPGCKNRQMFTKMIDVQIKAIKSKIFGLDIQKFQHKPKLLAQEGDDFTELEPRKIIAIE